MDIDRIIDQVDNLCAAFERSGPLNAIEKLEVVSMRRRVDKIHADLSHKGTTDPKMLMTLRTLSLRLSGLEQEPARPPSASPFSFFTNLFDSPKVSSEPAFDETDQQQMLVHLDNSKSEQDRLLDEISAHVSDAKGMAQAISDELDLHLKLIKDIDYQVDVTT